MCSRSPDGWEFRSHNKLHGTPDFFLFWLCFVINFFHTPIPSFLKLNKGTLSVLAISHGCDQRQPTRTASLSLVWRHRPPWLGRCGSSRGCRSSWLKRLTSGWAREQKEMGAGPRLAFSFSLFFSFDSVDPSSLHSVFMFGMNLLSWLIISRRTFTAIP